MVAGADNALVAQMLRCVADAGLCDGSGDARAEGILADAVRRIRNFGSAAPQRRQPRRRRRILARQRRALPRQPLKAGRVRGAASLPAAAGEATAALAPA